MSKEDNVKRIYSKEREYQKCCFGEYQDLESLNFASFLLFIERYLNKAKDAYCDEWTPHNNEEWLENCKEFENGTAPVKAYEELIKLFTLAGAALETFTTLNPEKWRENQENSKWKRRNF